MLLSKAAAGPADDRVCVTGHRGHKERVRTMERKPTSFYFQFSASFFSCLLLFCSRLTRLSVLAPLHSSCCFLGWELSSAAAWAWNGSEEREGAGDAERDLMRMYGCGCVCVCVGGSFSWQTHTCTPPLSRLWRPVCVYDGKSEPYLGSNTHWHDHTHL